MNRFRLLVLSSHLSFDHAAHQLLAVDGHPNQVNTGGTALEVDRFDVLTGRNVHHLLANRAAGKVGEHDLRLAFSLGLEVYRYLIESRDGTRRTAYVVFIVCRVIGGSVVIRIGSPQVQSKGL